MSAQVPSRPMTDEEPHESRWATGLVLFAGVVMMVTGVWHALAGLGALVNDKVYVSTPNYIYGFDLTGWGWIHILLGIVIAAAGFTVLLGMVWARIVGILVASVSLIANFMFIPHYPLWSILIIAFDIFVIWAVTAHGRDITD